MRTAGAARGATSVVVQIPLRTWLDEMWMRESAPKNFGESCLLAVVDVVLEGAGDVYWTKDTHFAYFEGSKPDISHFAYAKLDTSHFEGAKPDISHFAARTLRRQTLSESVWRRGV